MFNGKGGKVVVVELDLDSISHIEAPAPTAMALGYFDGVHKGHKAVIETAKAEAEKRGIQSAVMTFYPHPKEVLSKPDQPIDYLTPLQAKVARLKALGVDVVYVVNFTKAFSKLTPQAFIERFVIGLNVKHVVAGFDFTYGVKGEGKMDDIDRYANGRFTHTTVEQVSDEQEKISSTRIRKQLSEGNVSEAARLLGYPYVFSGTVVHGDARGRLIGYPTANIVAKERFIVPKTGVYVVTLTHGGNTYQGMANIGYKPTFVDDLAKPIVEVNIFDFNKEIYGETVEVAFYERIRSEQKFSGIDEIKAQLGRDRATALQFFKQHTANG